MNEDFQQVLTELSEAEQQGDKIELHLRPTSAFMLLANLQLALRHPGNTGESAELARTVCTIVAKRFANCPALSELIRRGWHPEYDNYDSELAPT